MVEDRAKMGKSRRLIGGGAAEVEGRPGEEPLREAEDGPRVVQDGRR